MAGKKKSKKKIHVSEEEVKTIEGLAGAKAGLTLASQLELLKARTAAIPIILGGAAGIMLPGKETEQKVKDAIKMVKESSMDKAMFVFQKISKCKSKKNSMQKKAVLLTTLGGAAVLAGGLGVAAAATGKDPVTGKKIDKKTMLIKKAGLGMAAGTLGFWFAPKPRQTALSEINYKGQNIAMKKMVNIPKK